MTLQEIAKATEGLLVIGDPKASMGAADVSTDSRSLRRGDLFFAIKGERADGHAHLEECVRKGAALCVVSQIPSNFVFSPVNFSALLKVKDTKKALGDLALFYREKFGEKIRRVGIVGSSGKTTVKDMAAQIFSAAAPTVFSPGNFNNEIGCPISVLGLAPSHLYGIFEIGASAKGDVKRLSEIVSPHVAIVTNISLEHSETFGSLESIAEGETEILPCLKNEGAAVLPLEDPFYEMMKSRIPQDRDIRVLSFGFSPKASVHAKDISTWPGPTKFNLVYQENGKVIEEIPCALPVFGKFNVLNACAASAAAFALEIPAKAIAQGLSQFTPSPMRFEVKRLKNEITVVNDSYNANPGSVRKAIEAFVESFSNKRLCVVLGDMLELGEISTSEHEKLGKFLAGFPFSKVILFGSQSKFTWHGATKALMDESLVTHCRDKESLLQAVEASLKPGTAILFKASRGMRLEETIKKMMDHLP